jgi:hypothetical protein
MELALEVSKVMLGLYAIIKLSQLIENTLAVTIKNDRTAFITCFGMMIITKAGALIALFIYFPSFYTIILAVILLWFTKPKMPQQV